MDGLPGNMIDALAIAWLEWLSYWGCFLEVRAVNPPAPIQAGRLAQTDRAPSALSLLFKF